MYFYVHLNALIVMFFIYSFNKYDFKLWSKNQFVYFFGLSELR